MAWELSTKASYTSSLNSFSKFVHELSRLPDPPQLLATLTLPAPGHQLSTADLRALVSDVGILEELVDWAHRRQLASATLTSIISSARTQSVSRESPYQLAPLPEYVDRLLVAYAKAHPRDDNRIALDSQLAARIIRSFDRMTWRGALLAAMFSLAMYGLMRVSEYTVHLHRSGLSFLTNPDGSVTAMRVTINRSKTSTTPVTLTVHATPGAPDLCPVLAMRAYLAFRDSAAVATPSLFCHNDGTLVSTVFVTAQLRLQATRAGADTSTVGKLSSHSFRIGGATTASQAGASREQIMAAGRWRSGAVDRYIRDDSALVSSAQQAVLSRLVSSAPAATHTVSHVAAAHTGTRTGTTTITTTTTATPKSSLSGGASSARPPSVIHHDRSAQPIRTAQPRRPHSARIGERTPLGLLGHTP